jgi:hypothetical protein
MGTKQWLNFFFTMIPLASMAQNLLNQITDQV